LLEFVDNFLIRRYQLRDFIIIGLIQTTRFFRLLLKPLERINNLSDKI